MDRKKPAGARLFQDLEQEVQQITELPQHAFDGLRIELSRPVSRAVFLRHMFAYGSQQDRPVYSFMTHVVHAPFRFQARWSPSSGSVFGHVTASFPGTSVAASASASAAVLSPSLEVDHRRPTTSYSMRVGHGEMSLSFVQVVRRWLSAGAFVAFTRSGESVLSGTVRAAFRSGPSQRFHQVWTASLSSLGSLRIGYAQRKQRGRQSWVALLDMVSNELGMVMSKLTAGYAYHFTHGVVKALCTSDMELVASIEESLSAILGVTLSADIDYLKDRYLVGVSIQASL